MATPVKQITAYTCMLAGIESLATDRGSPIGQQALIARFPVWCRQGFRNSNGQLEEGAIGILEFCHVLTVLGFASSFRSGIGQPFVENHRASISDGVFLSTINHPNGVHGGYHCWRIHDIIANGVDVVETSPALPRDYTHLPWPALVHLGCVATVCVSP